MSSVLSTGLVIAASVAAAGAASSQPALAGTGDGEAQAVAEAAFGVTHAVGGSANLTMHFIQDGGPESGQVRIELTPETRPLTIIEARTAAQQAFLEALKEPGLGENLRRITVVVRLMPRSHPDPVGAEQVIVFLHKGGSDWAVLPGQ
jgi:hypothetical protein